MHISYQCRNARIASIPHESQLRSGLGGWEQLLASKIVSQLIWKKLVSPLCASLNLGFPSQFIKSTKVPMATPQGRRLIWSNAQNIISLESTTGRWSVGEQLSFRLFSHMIRLHWQLYIPHSRVGEGRMQQRVGSVQLCSGVTQRGWTTVCQCTTRCLILFIYWLEIQKTQLQLSAWDCEKAPRALPHLLTHQTVPDSEVLGKSCTIALAATLGQAGLCCIWNLGSLY